MGWLMMCPAGLHYSFDKPKCLLVGQHHVCYCVAAFHVLLRTIVARAMCIARLHRCRLRLQLLLSDSGLGWICAGWVGMWCGVACCGMACCWVVAGLRWSSLVVLCLCFRVVQW